MTLLRHRLLGWDREDNWGALLLDYIGRISNDWFASNRENGIEFELWHAIGGGSCGRQTDVGMPDLSAEMKEDLLFLSKKLDGWAYYEAESGIVTLEEWKAISKIGAFAIDKELQRAMNGVMRIFFPRRREGS